MNPIHYTKVRPVPCPCCCQCCFMFITIFSCLLRNANPEFQLSLHDAMCMCPSVTHRDIFLFMQQISLLFLLCCWLCPQVNPTIRIFSHFYSLVVTFHSLFVVTFLSFCLFSLIFITFLLFVIFSSSVPNPPPVTFPHYSLKYFPPPKMISYPSLALTGTKV